MNTKQDPRVQALNVAGGFNTTNGLIIVDWQDGAAEVKIDLNPAHLNPLGLVHGGVYTSMLDVALAICGSYSPPTAALLPGLTLTLTTQFLAPMRAEDGFALARARRTGGGSSVFFATGEVVAPDGRVIATASGVFKRGRMPRQSV